MPKKKVEKVHLTITIDTDLNKWLEKMTAELRMNKSQLINNLIAIGKDDVALLKGVGLLGVSRTLREFKREFLEKKERSDEVEAGE
jgi:hypothetical protein